MTELNGYAATDRCSRLMKARKIEALLGCDVAGRDLLDLGAGAGFLADHFLARGASVTAADRDAKAYRGKVPLTPIEGETLPFADVQFDIVIFNHVIEHVGDASRQRAILSEIRRVLRPGGRLYIAVPNKWALIEPHFRLPLLGALPRRAADYLVRHFRKAAGYDCYPLTRAELAALLAEYFPALEDRTSDALSWVVNNELSPLPRRILSLVPDWLKAAAKPIYPTFVVLCRMEASRIGDRGDNARAVVDPHHRVNVP
ncbi:SAM-dependent methyltransferase [Sphingopyxis italica]|uniref:SAM-dependent methyltransferase n=1 Tax=Sphingopyxis italica TaxID=1129133 RepID=A0A7X6B7A9_9SPHN|nr:class I SAM-dependent methyltransferase [Sphingopyxis italica]NJB88114.1 SAM-dependent methyltransferase [Sphingopyxis italica]